VCERDREGGREGGREKGEGRKIPVIVMVTTGRFLVVVAFFFIPFGGFGDGMG
jgi:hypothetical protein